VFGIGGPELVLIVIVLLIFVGPDKLPQVAKTVGEGLRDLRRAANLAQAELKQGMDELTREVDGITRDVRQVVETAARDVDGAAPPEPPAESWISVPRRVDAAAPATEPDDPHFAEPAAWMGVPKRADPLELNAQVTDELAIPEGGLGWAADSPAEKANVRPALRRATPTAAEAESATAKEVQES
jgi:Tat protein translocase TatB subunit